MTISSREDAVVAIKRLERLVAWAHDLAHEIYQDCFIIERGDPKAPLVKLARDLEYGAIPHLEHLHHDHYESSLTHMVTDARRIAAKERRRQARHRKGEQTRVKE